MKPTRQILLLAIVISAFGSSLLGQEDDGQTAENRWIAKIGNRTIPFDDFLGRYSDFILANGMRDNIAARRAILDNMINEELILHFDEPGNLDNNPSYVNALENTRKQAILAYLKDRQVYARITVTDSELRQAFSRANEKLEARHLYAATEEEARELYELAAMGADFELLAKQVFSDSVLRMNGGYLGFFTWGDMDPAFEEAAYSLSPGEISEPVKTATGYSIIRLESRIPHPLLTETQFLQKKSHLERVLKIKKKRLAEQEYIRQVFNSDKVKFDDDGLRSLSRRLQSPHTVEQSPEGSSSIVCASFEGNSYSCDRLWEVIVRLSPKMRARINSTTALKATIKGIVLQERLLAIAGQKGFDTLSVVLDAWAKMQKALFLKFRLQEITNQASIAESALHAYYEANMDRFSSEREINVQEIVVSSAREAEQLKKEITGGSDFSDIARRHSLREWSAANGGVLGYAPLSRFGMVRDMLWEADEETMLGPVAVADRFCLFRVLGKKETTPIPFERVRGEVEESVRFEMQGTIVGDYLETLRTRVDSEANEKLLTSFDLPRDGGGATTLGSSAMIH